MIDFKKQFNGIDKQSFIILISSAILMCIFPYQASPEYFLNNFYSLLEGDPNYLSQVYRFFFTFFIFFLIPAFIITFILKGYLKDYGVQIGDYKFGLKFVLISVILLPIPIYLNSKSSDFLSQYPLWKNFGESYRNIFEWSFLYLFYYIGWEFFFRGYMQFGLIDKIPPFFIIMIQTISSTIIHIGKPQMETISAILAGIIFGAVALRTNSIFYCLFVHFYIGFLNEYFCYLNKINV